MQIKLSKLLSLAIGLTFFWSVACNQTGGLNSEGGAAKEEAATTTPTNELENVSERPTDEPEGVEGYLTDPKLVSVESSKGKTKVTGAAGAVGNKSGPVKNIQVGAWNMVPGKNPKQENGVANISAQNLGCTKSDGKGGFSLTVEQATDRLFVTAGLPCLSETLSIPQLDGNATHAAFPTNSESPTLGTFEDLFSRWDSSCFCPSGQIFYDGYLKCLKPYDSCDPGFYPQGEVCGCDGKTYADTCSVIAAGVKWYDYGSCK